VLFTLRPRRSFALAYMALEALRIPLLTAHFSVDRVQQIVDG